MQGQLRAIITAFDELFLSHSIPDMKKGGMEVNGDTKMMVPQFSFPSSEAQMSWQVICFNGKNPNETCSLTRV